MRRHIRAQRSEVRGQERTVGLCPRILTPDP
jgi:hypothetical protein